MSVRSRCVSHWPHRSFLRRPLPEKNSKSPFFFFLLFSCCFLFISFHLQCHFHSGQTLNSPGLNLNQVYLTCPWCILLSLPKVIHNTFSNIISIVSAEKYMEIQLRKKGNVSWSVSSSCQQMGNKIDLASPQFLPHKDRGVFCRITGNYMLN